MPSALARRNADPAVMAETIALLRAFGAPITYLANAAQGADQTSSAAAARKGVRHIGTELAGGGQVTPAALRACEGGLRRVLHRLGVLTEAPAEPKPEPPTAEARQDAVNSALAEALAGDPGPAEPVPQSSGPPLTQGEQDGLRVAVSRCWNLAALSTEAAQVSVVVGMEISLDGVPSNLRMISYRGGNDAAAQQAFETARRAVLRCQPYALPAEKYDQWRSIEMTFNPDEMRRR